jgi:hypothetical protein
MMQILDLQVLEAPAAASEGLLAGRSGISVLACRNDGLLAGRSGISVLACRE